MLHNHNTNNLLLRLIETWFHAGQTDLISCYWIYVTNVRPGFKTDFLLGWGKRSCAVLKYRVAQKPGKQTELAEELGVDQKTVWNHLKQLDYVHKKPRQDPHELTEAQAAKQVEICRQLLNNPLDNRFWKRIVTWDEKWVNHDRSKRWVPIGQTPPSVPKQNQFGKKIMICVWCNLEGILHFELVPNGRIRHQRSTLPRATWSSLRCAQLKSTQVLFVENALCFNRDNAKPHTARPKDQQQVWRIARCRSSAASSRRVQTLLHLTTVSSDQCSTLSKVADLSHSIKLKKHVKNFSIQSRRSATLTKSEACRSLAEGRGQWWSLFSRIVVVFE